ncbi:stalk domain-containing protein [Cellulosilyticum lentocellum]|uniref:YD repeat protein n=1 Tax=Cellulosilyticum lentocellum (strain ATCC 49066 / DSM 5427 / NCIMB 11756 / RHM5) TaxID=642492 RepID=F2JRQ3_CELLD|nr:stalk domain-containing protein [Cellulosilyticum lentocellum]ADZ85083.1 YD repeat protein [Cellulosilyticum lentocellum DSM 5427]
MKKKRVIIWLMIFLLMGNSIYAAEYFYDDLNRLVRVEYESGICIEYEYDNAGNICKITTTGADKSNEGEEKEPEEGEKEDKGDGKDSEDKQNENHTESDKTNSGVKNDTAGREKESVTTNQVILTLNSNIAVYNGQTIEMDATVMISKSNRLLVPVRYLAYALNISPEQIKWHAKTKEVEILGSKRIVIGIGKTYMLVNGIEVPLLEKAQIINGRTYLPIGDICRAFEVSYSWDNNTKQLSIVSK